MAGLRTSSASTADLQLPGCSTFTKWPNPKARRSCPSNTISLWKPSELLMKQGRLTLGTSPRTAVQFLKGLAAEAVSAGFQGLVVFADEVQQYLDTKTEDPYAKLFDFVNRFLVLAEQRVATGVILVIHSHHLASIESIRPDLVQRLKRDRSSLICRKSTRRQPFLESW
jgi:hypothetical protein